METHGLNEFDQKLVEVEGSRGHSLVVTATDVEDETSVVFENPKELMSEWEEPRNIIGLIDVSIFFLEVKSVRGRGDNCIHGRVWKGAEDIECVLKISGAKIRVVIRLKARDRNSLERRWKR